MHVWSRGLKVPVAAAVAAVTLTVAGCGSGQEPLVSASAQAAATSAAPSLDSQPPIEVPPELLPAWWAEAGDVFPAEYGIPAAYAPDYVFSDTPRGAHEQWIFDNYPEYWEAGVRAMSPIINWFPWGWDGKIDFERDANGNPIVDENFLPLNVYWPAPGPAPLVQFYDGVRYDGTPMLPLAFGKNDPMQRPPVLTGQGSRLLYSVSARTFGKVGFSVLPPSSGEGDREPFRTPTDKRGFSIPSVRVYRVDEVAEYLKSGEYIKAGVDVPESQWRKLLPGEISVTVRDEKFPIEGVNWDPVQEKFFIDKALCDWKPQYRTEYPDLCANQP